MKHEDMTPASVCPLVYRALVGTLAALAIGALIWLPVFLAIRGALRAQANQPSWVASQFEFFGAMPADDRALVEWTQARVGISEVKVHRKGQTVKLDYRSRATEPLTPPWEELGYGQQVGSSSVRIGRITIKLGAFFYVFLLARCADVGFLGLNVWYWRRAARDGEPAVRFWGNRPIRAALFGLALGVVAAAAFCVYDMTIGKLIGQAMGGWHAAVILPWWSQIVMFVVAMLVTPVSEEAWFRGAVFGSFDRARHVRAGAIVSAILFSLVQLNPGGLPAFFLFGLCLVWLYRRTGSLLAPVLAHAITNGVAVAIATGSGTLAFREAFSTLL